jgi:hypothetical protein
MYKNMTNEEFTAIVGNIFEFYFTDEVNVNCVSCSPLRAISQ